MAPRARQDMPEWARDIIDGEGEGLEARRPPTVGP